MVNIIVFLSLFVIKMSNQFMKWMQMDREKKYYTEQNVYSALTQLHVIWADWGYCLVPKKVLDNTLKCKCPKAPIS